MSVAKIVLEKKEEILKVCTKHDAHDVRVFSSVARGDFDAASDIDLLVRLNKNKLKVTTSSDDRESNWLQDMKNSKLPQRCEFNCIEAMISFAA